jgi:sialate O-acetylesterase
LGDFNGDFSYICNIKTTFMKKILLLAITLLTVSFADAEISLPQLFQSGMVLQRGKLIPIWGKAAPGELVTVRFNKKQYATTADAHGSWRINLPKMKAGGPYTLTVGNHVMTNSLIGDVWLLSGQSNIDVTIERVYPQYPEEIDS